jgi:hypothetical protein
MRWASSGVSPSATWLGSARRDPARQCTLRPGGVRQGLRWQHGGPTGLPCRLHWWIGRSQEWRGDAWQGEVGFGEVCHGWARVTDGGTEAPASLPPSQGWTCYGAQRHGGVGCGAVRSSKSRQGLQTAARSFYGGSLLLSLEGRCGALPHGRVGPGSARNGMPSQGKGWRFQRRGLWLPPLDSLESRRGSAVRGMDGHGKAGNAVAWTGMG